MNIVFDIGGTHMRVATATDGKTLSHILMKDTPPDFDEGMILLKKMILETAGGQPITGIAGGIAGILAQDGILHISPNLPGWVGHSLKDSLKELVNGDDTAVRVENDAAIAALGEVAFGAGRGGKIVAYYTISTGIGGARIVDGKIDASTVGFEPGKQIINADTDASVEMLASGRALENKYHEKPIEIHDEEIWKKAAHNVAVAAFNSIVNWSPDTFIFGGPMIVRKPGIDIEEVRVEIELLMKDFPEKPEIKLAELGEESGLYGALRRLTRGQ